MGIDIFDQIRANLLEKRHQLSNWLQTTPEPDREVQLGIVGVRGRARASRACGKVPGKGGMW